MRIYVDEKPNKCENCAFYQEIEKYDGMQNNKHAFQDINTPDFTPEFKIVNKCIVCNIAVSKEIAQVTTLGNCPLVTLQEKAREKQKCN